MQWKTIDRFPHYEVSENGDVRRNWRILKSCTDDWGYKTLTMTKFNGSRGTVYVHRVVAEAFIGPPPFEGAQACHNDSIKANNHYSNLRWDTPKGNAADKTAAGTENIGERNGRAKLTEADIVEIRRLVAMDWPRKLVGSEFGIAHQTVTKIVLRRRWPHVA